MQEIICWLNSVEQLASDLYADAAVYFEEDNEFSNFLKRISLDEIQHIEDMDVTLEYFKITKIQPQAEITLDQFTKEKVEKPLAEARELMLSKNLTKKKMIEAIVTVEFSEWNDIFLYVLNTFKSYHKKFQFMAAKIQVHEKRIERFVDTLSDEMKPRKDLRQLPHVWKNKILIVDDEEAILKLFKTLITKKGMIVETAVNGHDGLKIVKEHFFDLIITDIDMPILNGIDFYKQSVEHDSNMINRFLFLSGYFLPDVSTFLKVNDLPFFKKPVPLSDFLQIINDKLSQISENM